MLVFADFYERVIGSQLYNLCCNRSFLMSSVLFLKELNKYKEIINSSTFFWPPFWASFLLVAVFSDVLFIRKPALYLIQLFAKFGENQTMITKSNRPNYHVPTEVTGAGQHRSTYSRAVHCFAKLISC